MLFTFEFGSAYTYTSVHLAFYPLSERVALYIRIYIYICITWNDRATQCHGFLNGIYIKAHVSSFDRRVIYIERIVWPGRPSYPREWIFSLKIES